MAPPKILVAVDFSPESDLAVRHGMAIARHQGAELVLLHVGTILDPPEPGFENHAAGYRRAVEQGLRDNRERLESMRDRLRGQGVEVTHAVADGFPDTTILEVADEVAAGTIVLGTHGRTGLKWFLLGSIAQRVVRLAERDVLVARGDAPAGGYRKICVATDFSPSSERALESALALAASGAEIDLVHCWYVSPTFGASGEPLLLQALLAADRSGIEHGLRERGDALIAAHRRPGVTVRFEPVFAPARAALIERLEGGGHDLVALGSHGRRGVRRFVLGSVAESTVARAPCSVLVAHGS
jgi:nucleotide-binding universal stress UspA family protein